MSSSGWQEQYDPASGRKFYVNHETRETSWDPPPTVDTPPNGTPLPPGWAEMKTADGRTFYVDHNTKQTQWQRPTLASVGAAHSTNPELNNPHLVSSESATTVDAGHAYDNGVENQTEDVTNGVSGSGTWEVGDIVKLKLTMFSWKCAIVLSFSESNSTYSVLVDDGRRRDVAVETTLHQQIPQLGDWMKAAMQLLQACVSSDMMTDQDRADAQMSIMDSIVSRFSSVLHSSDDGNTDKRSVEHVVNVLDEAKGAALFSRVLSAAHARRQFGVVTVTASALRVVTELRCSASGGAKLWTGKLIAAGVIPALCSCLETENYSLKDAALHTFLPVAEVSSFSKALLDAKGIPLVCETLMELELQETAVSIISALLTTDDGKSSGKGSSVTNAIRRARGPQYLCAILEGSDSPKVQQTVLAALQVLIKPGAEGANVLRAAGGVSALVSVLKNGASDQTVRASTMEILSGAAVDGAVATALLDAGAAELAVAACDPGVGGGETAKDVEQALRMLQSMANIEPASVVAAGGLLLAIDIVSARVSSKRKKSSSKLEEKDPQLEAAVSLIAVLASAPASGQICRDAGGFTALVDLLLRRSATSVKKTAMAALCSLSLADANNRACAAEAGAVAACLACESISNELMQGDKALLASLLQEAEVMELELRRIGGDVVELEALAGGLVSMLSSTQRTAVKARAAAASALYTFVSITVEELGDPECRQDLRLSALSKVKPVQALLPLVKGGSQAAGGALMTLSALAEDPRALADMQAARAVPLVAAALPAWSADLQTMGLKLLRSLVSGPSTKHLLAPDIKQVTEALTSSLDADNPECTAAAARLGRDLSFVPQHRAGMRAAFSSLIPLLRPAPGLSGGAASLALAAAVDVCAFLIHMSNEPAAAVAAVEAADGTAVPALVSLLGDPGNAVADAALHALEKLCTATPAARRAVLLNGASPLAVLLPLLPSEDSLAGVSDEFDATVNAESNLDGMRERALNLLRLLCQEQPQAKEVLPTVPGLLQQLLGAAQREVQMKEGAVSTADRPVMKLLACMQSEALWDCIAQGAAVGLALYLLQEKGSDTEAACSAVQSMCGEQPAEVLRRLSLLDLSANGINRNDRREMKNDGSGIGQVVKLLASPVLHVNRAAGALALVCATHPDGRRPLLNHLPSLLRLMASFSGDVSAAALKVVHKMALVENVSNDGEIDNARRFSSGSVEAEADVAAFWAVLLAAPTSKSGNDIRKLALDSCVAAMARRGATDEQKSMAAEVTAAFIGRLQAQDAGRTFTEIANVSPLLAQAVPPLLALLPTRPGMAMPALASLVMASSRCAARLRQDPTALPALLRTMREDVTHMSSALRLLRGLLRPANSRSNAGDNKPPRATVDAMLKAEGVAAVAKVLTDCADDQATRADGLAVLAAIASGSLQARRRVLEADGILRAVVAAIQDSATTRKEDCKDGDNADGTDNDSGDTDDVSKPTASDGDAKSSASDDAEVVAYTAVRLVAALAEVGNARPTLCEEPNLLVSLLAAVHRTVPRALLTNGKVESEPDKSKDDRLVTLLTLAVSALSYMARSTPIDLRGKIVECLLVVAGKVHSVCSSLDKARASSEVAKDSSEQNYSHLHKIQVAALRGVHAHLICDTSSGSGNAASQRAADLRTWLSSTEPAVVEATAEVILYIISGIDSSEDGGSHEPLDEALATREAFSAFASVLNATGRTKTDEGSSPVSRGVISKQPSVLPTGDQQLAQLSVLAVARAVVLRPKGHRLACRNVALVGAVRTIATTKAHIAGPSAVRLMKLLGVNPPYDSPNLQERLQFSDVVATSTVPTSRQATGVKTDVRRRNLPPPTTSVRGGRGRVDIPPPDFSSIAAPSAGKAQRVRPITPPHVREERLRLRRRLALQARDDSASVEKVKSAVKRRSRHESEDSAEEDDNVEEEKGASDEKKEGTDSKPIVKEASTRIFKAGERVLYSGADGTESLATVSIVHNDGADGPYYTIRLPNGHDRQTLGQRLSVPSASDIEKNTPKKTPMQSQQQPYRGNPPPPPPTYNASPGIQQHQQMSPAPMQPRPENFFSYNGGVNAAPGAQYTNHAEQSVPPYSPATYPGGPPPSGGMEMGVEAEPRTFEEKVARLKSLGFEEADAVRALTKSKFDLNEAASMLISDTSSSASAIAKPSPISAVPSLSMAGSSPAVAYPGFGAGQRPNQAMLDEAKRQADEKESEEMARRLQAQFDTEAKEDSAAGVISTDSGIKGTLWKQSKFRKAWRKRFVWLDGATLRTYTVENASGATEENARDTFEITEESKVEDVKDKAQEYAFKVTNTGKDGSGYVVFASKDEKGKQRWRTAISEALKVEKKREEEAKRKALREKSSQLQAMGYGEAECMAALEQADGELDAAVELLLNGEVNVSSSSQSTSSPYTAAEAKEDDDLAAAIAASLADSGAPTPSSLSSGQRTLQVTIPANAVPGQEMMVQAGGQNYRIRVPAQIPANRTITMAY